MAKGTPLSHERLNTNSSYKTADYVDQLRIRHSAISGSRDCPTFVKWDLVVVRHGGTVGWHVDK